MLGGLGRQKWDGWSWYCVEEPTEGGTLAVGGAAFELGALTMAPADPGATSWGDGGDAN